MYDTRIGSTIMQDIRTRFESSNSSQNTATSNTLTTAQMNFYQKNNLNDDLIIGRLPNFEDDPRVELNNCRKIIEKPPMVKRFTMGILRTAEDSHPLMRNPSLSTTSSLSQSTSDGYVNEAICDSEKAISDSCRQSLFAATDDARYLSKQCETNKSNQSSPISKSNQKSVLPTSKVIHSDIMTLAEQHELKGAAWFQAGIPREICLEVLSRQPPGAFLVRKSSSKSGCFALSLRTPPPGPKVVHYLVLRTAKGYKIKGFTKEFSSLRTLITHHSVMPELLPVPLALPRTPLNTTHNMDDVNSDTYGSLNDFQKMMSDLNL